MKWTFYLVLFVVAWALKSCQGEPSLQKYFVDKSESKDFVSLDVSPSILKIDPKKISASQKEALASFDKINILAFKVDKANRQQFEKECANVQAILKNEKYEPLMKFATGKEGASLSCVSEQEKIEEYVFFANQNETGFAVVRVLGDDMNPTTVFQMISLLQKSDIDLSQLKPLQELIGK